MTATIQSIERAFSILQIVSDHPNGIRVSALAEKADLHISTVSRILTTLEQVQAVQRPSSSGEVRLGGGLISMVSKAPWSERLVTVAKPFLERLAQRTGEAAGLNVSDDEKCRVLVQVPGDYNVQIRDWSGEHFPLHVASGGKLYLAHVSPAKLTQLLQRPLVPFTPATITDPQQLRQHIVQVRRQGYAWTSDELEEGLTTVAAPIYEHNRQFIASVYVSAPAFRYASPAEQARLGELVVESGREITAHLGRLGIKV